MGRDHGLYCLQVIQRLISIHPPRVGRDKEVFGKNNYGDISIHPPRVGRDGDHHSAGGLRPDFNPPSPCGEGPQLLGRMHHILEFQSTLPVWGGTVISSPVTGTVLYFNPPSPCGEGPATLSLSSVRVGISIHPPRVGRDSVTNRYLVGGSDFNPPSPCGEGLSLHSSQLFLPGISIHPPRVGRDLDGLFVRCSSN